MFGIFRKKKNQDTLGLLWHNHDKKLSCRLIPKCASNSIRDMTGCHAGPNLKRYKDYQVFAVLRNPMDRYISSFMEVMIPASDYPRGRYHHENLRLSEDFVRILDRINQGDVGERFIRFTDLILEKGFFEIHTKLQRYFLKECGSISLYKLENISPLLEDFGVEREIFENKTESSGIKKELTDLLATDAELRNKVSMLYAQDIALYESFEDKKQTNF